MRRKQLIQELRRAAEAIGENLKVAASRRGIHVSTEAGGVALRPNRQGHVHPNNLAKYFKKLGLPVKAFG